MIIFRATFDSRFLTRFPTASLYCRPQAVFFCNMLSFHFQNMAIAGVCWKRGIRKRERLLFIKRKLLFVSADLTVFRCWDSRGIEPGPSPYQSLASSHHTVSCFLYLPHNPYNPTPTLTPTSKSPVQLTLRIKSSFAWGGGPHQINNMEISCSLWLK